MSMPREGSAVRTDSKAEQLAQYFQRLIESGAIASGARIGTKQEIMRQHEVAAGTLNEAMRLLQSRGYIEVKSGPKGGAFAARQATRLRLRHSLIEAIGDPQEISDVIAVRDELEVLVAVEAARVCTPADQELILAAEAAAAAAEPGQERLLKIWDLHREIARTGRNRILSTFYESLLDTLAANLGTVEVSTSVPRGVRDDTGIVHRNLVEAIVTNDVEAAVRAAQEHTPIGRNYGLVQTDR